MRVDQQWAVCAERLPGCQGWTADSAAVDSVISALRGAHWHRRAHASVAGAVTRTLDLDGVAIGLGATVEGSDQRWLVVNKVAVLVDGWVARALFPGKDALI